MKDKLYNLVCRNYPSRIYPNKTKPCALVKELLSDLRLMTRYAENVDCGDQNPLPWNFTDEELKRIIAIEKWSNDLKEER